MGDDSRYHMKDATGEEITLTESQKKCVDYDSKTALVIKGTAGSGKSLMIIKRATEYRNEITSQGSRKRITIFTFNRSLRDGILYVLDRNGIPYDDGILSVSTADKYIADICRRLDLIPKVNSGYSGLGNGYDRRYNAGDNRTYTPHMESNDERLAIMKNVLKSLSAKKNHPYYQRDPQIWVDEVLWMYRNGIVDSDDEERYLNLSREGRCKNYTMHLNKKGRKVVMGIFNEYNMALMNKGRYEWDRIYAMLYRDHLTDIPRDNLIDYVLVDEAQDLSLVKMAILARLCSDELNVAMDKNQSLYGHRWSFKRDLNLNVHVKKLEVMHRGTKEIDEFSNDLKRVDDTLLEDEDRYQNELSPKVSDILPEVVRCSSSDAEMEFIINEIRAILSSDSSMANIAILCPDHKNLHAFEDKLNRNGIPVQFFRDKDFNALEPGVKLITIHSSKGLGFIYVFIPYIEEGVFPKSVESIIASINRSADIGDSKIDIEDAIKEEISESRRLLYVGITRARLKVTITYSGNPSRFLQEFDSTHYILVDESHRLISDENISLGSVNDTLRPTLKSEWRESESQITLGHYSNQDTDSNDPIHILEKLGVEYVDNRGKGTVLWIVAGHNSDEAIRILRGKGYEVGYSESPRATNRRPAYYTR